MFLESMILHNFRCFSDIEIKFNNRLTVVVGNNVQENQRFWRLPQLQRVL